MKGKTIVGMIATAALCVVLTQVSTNLKEENKRDFQEALDKYKNSSSSPNDSIVHQRMMNDVQTLKKKYEKDVLPTKGEIDSVNAKLPVLISEGTLCTQIEYDENTKVQTFHYRFTQEVDENMISKEVIGQLKSNMISALKKDANNIKRLNAGMVFLYIYYSIENRKLYEIKIDTNDLK